MAFNMNEPLYNQLDASSDAWPKYLIRDELKCWNDGTAVIMCNSPRHAAGYDLNLKVVWEYKDGSYTFNDIQRWTWDRCQVSSLCAYALVAHLNQERRK